MTIAQLDRAAVSPEAAAAGIPDSVGAEAPSSFLQTPFWAFFKAAHGWKPYFFVLSTDQAEISAGRAVLLTVLVRRFFRLASIAYVPLGPDLPCDDPVIQGRLLGELGTLLAPFLPSNTLCIRFDPPWGTRVPNRHAADDSACAQDAPALPPEPAAPARRAPANIQPPDTVVLDLSLSEDELLAGMKPKWRYNIRLGEKKGVQIRYLEGAAGAQEGVDTFYSLYQTTASRDGIAVHSRGYYADLVARAANRGPGGQDVSVRVYIAEHEGTPLASIITLFCGTEAVYLYGASSNEKRNLMPAYSLQWQAIRDAKAAGCARYDFYGIPPEDDPSHPMYGLYRFKTGFGGSIVHRVGSLDIPLRSGLYGLYRIAESARAFWFKRVVKFFRKETRR